MLPYRKASFHGVEFEVTSRSWASGRRNQVHEYPDKDTPYTEDLGKKYETYQVTAYVIGSDYQSRRDSLRKACLQKDVGTLIHPDYGSVEVVCDAILVKEEYTTQRMAVIELTFIESGEKAIPETTVDFPGKVSSSASRLTDSAKSGFAKAFAISDGVNGLVSLLGNISGICTSCLNNIGTGIGYVEGLRSDVQGAMNKIVSAASLALDLKNSAKNLLNTPASLAANIDTVFSAIASLSGSSSSSSSAASGSSSSSSSSSVTTAAVGRSAPNSFYTIRNLTSASNASKTASVSNEDARAEKKCMQQIEQLTKQVVVAKEAEAITSIEFSNAEEAETILDIFLEDAEKVELFEDVEPEPEIIQSLRDLREIVVDYVHEIVLELPRTKTLKLNGTLPSLALAYNLYEDVDRADEIVKKNQIQFPAFIPAGKELKVLTE